MNSGVYAQLTKSATAASIELDRAVSCYQWCPDRVKELANLLETTLPNGGRIDTGVCLVFYHAPSALRQVGLSARVADIVSAVRSLIADYKVAASWSQSEAESGRANYLRDVAVNLAHAAEVAASSGAENV